ncbi:sulfotransferase [Rhodanobacter sp. ANJX3]|uniref:tetratricopeptide repeat-containing sulfotransferase family protein n=1 Tax=unclassified Rhodanobacter TaxID=2621553 RepID=UPI0031B81697
MRSISWRTSLPGRPPAEWLEAAQSLTLGGYGQEALALLEAGHASCPYDSGLSLALAGFYLDRQRYVEAERLLNAIRKEHPSHLGAAFMLARVLRAQGQFNQMAQQLVAAVSQHSLDAELAIKTIEALDDADRKMEAYTLCQRALNAECADDARLHAYAGMLALQLGQFVQARAHYEAVLEHAGEPRAWEWHIAGGLSQSQRYVQPADVDLQRFQQALRRNDISPTARIELLFALGKLHDDLGDAAAAAEAWREANTLAHAHSRWSRKNWRRMIDARIRAAPMTQRPRESRGWAPLFVVGVPRSGTTLLAQRLTSLSDIVQRGELRWLPELAAQLPDVAQVALLAEQYELQLRQDDRHARWFIDKQPLNLLHIDLILALWPDAKIVCCVRNTRDNALSIWTQRFGDPAHDYAYNFNDIAAVIQGCHRLTRHWLARYPASVRLVSYETMVAAPDAEIASLGKWLNADSKVESETRTSPGMISTASLWQARQPIYQTSVGRWRTYEKFFPELLRFDS